MYDRFYTWIDGDLESQAESGWENTLVGWVPWVDVRLKLKGYGWKENGTADVVVTHPGRYECYYRERGTSTWIKFATVYSERETSGEDRVYKDTFIELGKVDEDVYELLIVAADAAKFTAWGGTLEGIEEDGEFWYDMLMRTAVVLKVDANDVVTASEYAILGRTIVDLEISDEVSIEETLLWFVGFPVYGYDTVGVHDELTELIITWPVEVYDALGIVEDFSTETDWVNVATPAETPTITEVVEFWFDYWNCEFFEELTVEENVEALIEGLDLTAYDEVQVDEYGRAWGQPPWHMDEAEEFELEEVASLAPVYELYTDDCSSLTGWTDLSTGTGDVSVDSGSFLFTGDGLSNKGVVKKSTGVNCGRYYSLEFKIKLESDEGDAQVQIGGQRTNIRFTLIQDDVAPGDILFDDGTTFLDAFDARSDWATIRVDILEECGNGYGNMVDLYVNDVYVGRSYCSKYGSISNGQIQFGTTGSTSGSFRIDDIVIQKLEEGLIKYVWARDDITSVTSDVQATEVLTIEKYDVERAIVVYEEVTVAEFIGTYSELFISVYEDLTQTVEEYVGVSLDVLNSLVYDEAVISELVVRAGEYIYLSAIDIVALTEVAYVTDLMIEIGIVIDVLSVTESVEAASTIEASAYDELTVEEYAEGELPPMIYVYDEVGIAEVGTIHDIVIELGPVFETVSIVEYISMHDIIVEMSVFEELTITEDLIAQMVLEASVFDTVGVFEFIYMHDIIVELSVYEEIVTSEWEDVDVALVEDLYVDVGDDASAEESPVVAISEWLASVYDEVLVTEQTSILDLVIEVGIVADEVSVTEDADGFLGEWNASVYDEVAVTEYGQAERPDKDVSVSDDVGVEEWVSVGALALSVYDEVTVTESFEGAQFVNVIFEEWFDNLDEWTLTVTGSCSADIVSGAWRHYWWGYGRIDGYRDENYTDPALYEWEIRIRHDYSGWGSQWVLANGWQRIVVEFAPYYGTLLVNSKTVVTPGVSANGYNTYRFVVSAANRYDTGGIVIVDVYANGTYCGTVSAEVSGWAGTANKFYVDYDQSFSAYREWHTDWMRVTSRGNQNDIYRSFKEDISIEENVTMQLEHNVAEDSTVSVQENVDLEVFNAGQVWEYLSVEEDVQLEFDTLLIQSVGQVMLLHFDGPDGAKKAVDSSKYGHPLTFVGTAELDTAEKVFGPSSLKIPADQDEVQVAYNEVLKLGTDDFFIELRVNLSEWIVNRSRKIMQYGDYLNNYWEFYYSVFSNQPRAHFLVKQGGFTRVWMYDDISLTTDEWHTIAVSREGDTFREFFDGVLIDTYTYSGTMPDIDTVLRVGDNVSDYDAIHGWVDEVVIIKGMPVHTSNYTPRTTPWPDGEPTEELSVEEDVTVQVV